MRTRHSGETGAALALVVIFGLVLSILAGAVYTLFQSNVSSYTYVRDRIQARYSAEAGVNLAVHMIMGGGHPAGHPADPVPPGATGHRLLRHARRRPGPGPDLG